MSINVISGEHQSFKLTPEGIEFATALSMGDAEKLKTTSIDLISKSHLNDLKVIIENDGDKITKEKLFKFMKTKAKIKGDTLSDMPTNSATGMNCLLEWFGKIGLVSNEVSVSKILASSGQKQPKKKSSNNKKRRAQSPNAGIVEKPIMQNPNESHVLKTEHVSLLISKNIELEDLELAKKQTDLLFEHAKSKIKPKID